MSVQTLGVIAIGLSVVGMFAMGLREFFVSLLSEDEEARKELSAQGRRCGMNPRA